MNDRHPGVWVGVVFMTAGLILALIFTERDAFALGGAGLIVAGALAIAVSFEEKTER